MFETKVLEKINTYILFSKTFFFIKSCHLWENVENYFRTGQATNDNMERAHCMFDIAGYKYTLGIYITDCFSNTPIVA